METSSVMGISNDPSFIALVRRRGRFVIYLTAATLVPYYAFILVAGFHPQLLATKLSSSSTINLGWLIGVMLIVGTWLLTGLYVRRANREFDELAAEIIGRGAQ